MASKGYLEAVTWSFTDSKINQLFIEENKQVEIINPISSDLNVLRNSIFSNLIIYLNKNLDRGFKDISLFEIGPIFYGTKPGEQKTVISGLRSGKVSRLSWLEKERLVDVFDVKKDVVQSLVEAGFSQNKLYIDDKTPNYYHPGKSGRVYLSKEKEKVVAFFGEIHPNILKKIDIKTECLVGFEIFLDNIKQTKKSLKDQKTHYQYSDYQKSERDFAFVIDKDFKVQELAEVISNIDQNLIKAVKVFDVFQGENIPEDKKSIALNVTIQSSEKTLTDEDLDKINQLIISTVETKTGAKIRS
jgi:phenylalanyl-tRNA synthetase beta chain